MPTITWSNGTTTTADTWTELLTLVRKMQWHYYTDEEFRAALAKRCLRWSGTVIDPYGSPYRLMLELERAQLIRFGDLTDDEKK